MTHQHPNVNWALERRRFRERTLDQLARVGLSDVRERIRYEKILTPADWDEQYHIHRGATFNLAHSLSQMLHLRPRNRFEDFGLARAILPRKQDEAGPGLDQRRGIGAEIREGEAADGHAGWLSRYCSRRSITS